MSSKRRLKPIDAKNNHKIEKYFSVVPQRPKRRLDENSEVNDENKVNAPSPCNSQQQKPIKRPFGEVKNGGGLKEVNNVRMPLSDKNPQKPLLSTSTLLRHNRATTPKFAVLCDEDIQKGVEKAPTPPSASPYNSQEEVKSKIREFDSQVIPPRDTQWTEISESSPLPLVSTQDSTQFTVYKDDDSTQNEKQSSPSPPFEVYKDDEESQLSLPPFEVYKDEESPPPPFEIYKGKEDDDDDDDDLFTKTKDATVKFERSLLSLSGSFFSEAGDNPDDSKSTESNFFSDNNSNEEDACGGFTIGGDEFSFVNPEVEISLSDISSLPSKTLSQEPETLSQIIVPFPNPRGNDILEKLNLPKEPTQNEEEEEEDDGLPIFE